jgi:hypothetical protein
MVVSVGVVLAAVGLGCGGSSNSLTTACDNQGPWDGPSTRKCLEYRGLSSDEVTQINALCSSDNIKASCPTTNVLGTCTTNYGTLLVTYYYSDNGASAAHAQIVCEQGLSGTWKAG